MRREGHAVDDPGDSTLTLRARIDQIEQVGFPAVLKRQPLQDAVEIREGHAFGFDHLVDQRARGIEQGGKLGVELHHQRFG